MKIAFDHQAFTLQKTGGISRYFCCLAENLNDLNDSDIEKVEVGIFAPFYRNQYLRKIPKTMVHGFPVSDYPSKTAALCVNANRLFARHLIKKWQPDVVHETYFSSRKSTTVDCPVVLTVFDMISELESVAKGGLKNDLRATAKHRSVMRADHVICISKATKQDLINLYDIPEHKVSVIYLGCDTQEDTVDVAIREKNQKSYLLYVGLRDGYKNFNGLLNAIAASPLIMKDFEVIAFGGGAFNDMERNLIKELGFGINQVKQFSGEDSVLKQFYKNAAALVYPSTHEGFGLPPLEAMSYQCPVVSSNTSCMPEIIDQAGQYFDPYSTESMRNAIEAVIFSPSRTKELIKIGLERHKLFGWKNCAQKTLDIYRALAPVAH